MAIQTILIPLDFSSCAANVALRGGAIARQLGAAPILLHVVPPPELPLDAKIPIGEGPDARERTVEELLLGSARLRLERYVELLGDHAHPPRTIVRIGPVAETIVDEADECDAGLIVMGTRGRTGIARVVLGSVADQVVRIADVPVTTIRSHWHTGCAVRSCNWCIEEATPEERRVAAEQYG